MENKKKSSDNRFIEEGNASIIEEVCYPYNTAMYVYQAIVDFCSEQLAGILVQKTEHESKVYCEPIQKFIVDMANGDLLVYSIYSDQREGFDESACFVIRKLLWKKKKDIDWLQKYPQKRQDALLSWPTIETKNRVIYYSGAERITRLLQQTDELTKYGIVLNERSPNNAPYWRNMRDIELMRRYEWGEIHYTWGMSMQNAEVEKHIYSSIETLDIELSEISEEINKMELDYIFPIEEFKKYVVGWKDRP